VQVDESGNLVIARILGGGMIDRQGLLHIGDTILEVNGVPVSTPEDLQIQISRAKESVALKIGPSFEDAHTQLNGSQVKCKYCIFFSLNSILHTTNTLCFLM
jgi:S1-C subfamily serine protease